MSLASLISQVAELVREVTEASRAASAVSQAALPFRASAENLVQYLALRRHDLRPLQDQLSRHGLSSLGRCEPRVLASLRAVHRALEALAGQAQPGEEFAESDADWDAGPRLLREHAEALLGPAPAQRSARIMVTLPREAAADPRLARSLLERGMDCLRINCAHDEPAAWRRMVEHVRQAERDLGRRCRVCMDLAGPKLRTGPLVPLPGVLKVRPRRDDFGRIVAPARVLLVPAVSAAESPGGSSRLPLAGASLADLAPGAVLHLRDARGAQRQLQITAVAEGSAWAETRRTCYFTAGLELRRTGQSPGEPAYVVAELPSRPSALVLSPGDLLLLTRSLEPGRPAVRGPGGEIVPPARISCTLPAAFDALQEGRRVHFDDGRITGEVASLDASAAAIQITRTRGGGATKLRGDKGINLPDTQLDISPLTEKDWRDLPLVCELADMVALSFANAPEDVRTLREGLARCGARQPAIVLKIETRRGFENLPALLLEAMRTPACGVMIARGDLAVECGFERLAELQEEILWICEAAHVPVIWATQVLESLAQEGLPSRAEITDAAMGDRAECVMLNKGPHILRAMQTLDDILQRMHSHQSKKRAMLRRLRLASHFFKPLP